MEPEKKKGLLTCAMATTDLPLAVLVMVNDLPQSDDWTPMLPYCARER